MPGTHQRVGEQRPRVRLVQHDEIRVRPPQPARERRGDRDRADGADRPDARDRHALDDFLDGRPAGVHRQHAALDEAFACTAQRLDDPLHAAGDRRIELADVQHALHASTVSLTGTGCPAMAP